MDMVLKKGWKICVPNSKGHGQYDKTFYGKEILKSAGRGESIEISLPSC
jgi:hypothetical protein